jgi:peptidoglycan/LPS O-acetylase OafA/YrhL
MPVLIAVAWALLTVVPAPLATTDLGATAVVLACAIVTAAISLLLAHVSFAFIESPCMAIGRLWSKRIEFGTVERPMPEAAARKRYASL